MEKNSQSKNTNKRLGNVFFIGLLSFFGGISQDIFVPILPLYLTTVLHLDKSIIGLSEGLVDSVSSIIKIITGYLSDKFRSNKLLIGIGYGLSMISRPLLALVSGGTAVIGLRFIDGVGKGIKDSPKDVLIAATTNVKNRGRGFGIARMLDTMGSVAGPLILFLMLYFLRNNSLKYHYILFASAIPLFFTLAILRYKVVEASAEKSFTPLTLAPGLPKTFYWFLAIVIIFSLGSSSDAFLILRAQSIGLSLLEIPLAFALFNLSYALAAIPLGSLSDKIGRESVIIIGWAVYTLAYIGFGLANQNYQVWILFIFYGLYYATTEGAAKALVADMVPASHRGRAYGIFNTLVGVMMLPASMIAGLLWDKFGPAVPFYFGALAACIGTILLTIFIFLKKHQNTPVFE